MLIDIKLPLPAKLETLPHRLWLDVLSNVLHYFTVTVTWRSLIELCYMTQVRRIWVLEHYSRALAAFKLSIGCTDFVCCRRPTLPDSLPWLKTDSLLHIHTDSMGT